MAEVILLDTTVSQEDRQTIERYLAHKWGLAEKLPAGHPYKDDAARASSAVAGLGGSANDPENDPLIHTWSVVSGPGPVIFANSSMLRTNATFTVAGEYTLRLTSDDGNGSSFDEVVVTVISQPGFAVTYKGNGETGGSGTGFYYHGTSDPSASAKHVGTTFVTITGTAEVNFPTGQGARSFTLTGAALNLVRSYYDGHTPTRSTAYFRFNMGVDPAAAFSSDANSDGVADGLAWLLGAADPTTNAAALLPFAGANHGALNANFTMLTAAKR